eukprot:m.169528 g.169528  ORF g.169528 m.169528 type:complete len:774 (+) comp16670_c0_seq1:187-2508(+)
MMTCMAAVVTALFVVAKADSANEPRFCNLAGLKEGALTAENCSTTARSTDGYFPTNTSCQVECSEYSYLHNAYICRDGRWYPDLTRGQLCTPFRSACEFDGDRLVCNGCTLPPTTKIKGLPRRMGAGIREVTILCHDLTRIQSEAAVSVGSDLVVLNLAHNKIHTLYLGTFGFLPSLRILNLSNNALSDILQGDFPRYAHLTSLDISHNPIVAVGSLALAASLTRDCQADVTFRDDGSACPCELVRRNQTCNRILCSCEPPPLTVSCSLQAALDGMPTIPADQLCDGIVDCPNCADERLCDFSFNLKAADLETCLSETPYLRVRNGAGYIRPKPGYQQSKCGLVPYAESIGFPLEPLVHGMPPRWTYRSNAGNLHFNVTVGIVDVNTLLLTMQLDGALGTISIVIPVPLDCPIKAAEVVTGSQANFPLALVVACSAIGLVLLLFLLVGRSMRKRVKLAKVSHSSHSKELEMTIDRLLTEFGRRATMADVHGQSQTETKVAQYSREEFSSEGRDLGSGNFGSVQQLTVKQSRQALLKGQEVAVKTFPALNATEGLKEAISEACLLHSLQHAHIVTLLGIINDRLPLSLVLELAPLGDLRSYVQQHSIAVDTKLCMLEQCASAVAFVHSQKVLHRDLALRNVLTFSSEPPLVKLSDFGMGRRLNRSQDYYRSTSPDNMPFRWMAPESLTNGKFTSASDAWSFGILAWELLEDGRTPYQKLTMQQVLQFHVQGIRLEVSDPIPDRVYELLGFVLVSRSCGTADYGCVEATIAADLP